MEVDPVDPVAEPVVGPQLREVPVRLPRQLLDTGGPDRPSRVVEMPLGPGGTEGRDDRPEGLVGRECVVVGERRRLVQHRVGGIVMRVGQGHPRPSERTRGHLDAVEARRPAPDTERCAAMLQLRPNCECCDRDLPPDSIDARICTFECTFGRDCADTVFHAAVRTAAANWSGARCDRPSTWRGTRPRPSG
jgi:hypothetical protein